MVKARSEENHPPVAPVCPLFFSSSLRFLVSVLSLLNNLWQMGFSESFQIKLLPSHENNPPQRKYVFCGVELRLIASNTLRLPAVESSSDQAMFP